MVLSDKRAEAKWRTTLRRLLLLTVLFGFPALTILPAFAAQHGGQEHVIKSPLSHPVSHATKASKSTHTGSHKKKRKHHKKKTPTPRPAAPTVPPTDTPTPTATPTFTPTPTPTPTDTPTPTATTPPPSQASAQLSANVPAGYAVAFIVCGLPSGVYGSVVPTPSLSSRTQSLWTATLRVLATVAPGTYPLDVFPLWHDPHGQPTTSPPGGTTTPIALVLTVNSDGSSSLTSSQIPAGSGRENCTDAPPGFGQGVIGPPAQTVSVRSRVSDPHPVQGETEVVYGTLVINGQPVQGALMRTNWYMPGGQILSCDGSTDATGTALCEEQNTFPIPGFTVQIEVYFQYNGQQYTTYSSFVM